MPESRSFEIDIDDDGDYVTFWGTLSIDEALNFLTFYKQCGFTTLEVGDQNSTMAISKRKIPKSDAEKNEYYRSLIDLRRNYPDALNEFNRR